MTDETSTPPAPEPIRSVYAENHTPSSESSVNALDLFGQGNPVCRDASECHINGHCRPSGSGSCCECQPQFYGNGKLCIDKGMVETWWCHKPGFTAILMLFGTNINSRPVADNQLRFNGISRSFPSTGFHRELLHPDLVNRSEQQRQHVL